MHELNKHWRMFAIPANYGQPQNKTKSFSLPHTFCMLTSVLQVDVCREKFICMSLSYNKSHDGSDMFTPRLLTAVVALSSCEEFIFSSFCHRHFELFLNLNFAAENHLIMLVCDASCTLQVVIGV